MGFPHCVTLQAWLCAQRCNDIIELQREALNFLAKTLHLKTVQVLQCQQIFEYPIRELDDLAGQFTFVRAMPKGADHVP